ncbi:MAG: hypothetical protein LBU61_01125, partial [Coriobacteriales bacterium]|nr:hypothetical protein [Coriobacteriales bacterium]
MKRDFSNLITLLLVSLILTAGILLPNLIYPELDPFMEQITQLSVSAEPDSYVFQELVRLYPWDIYDPRDTSPLSDEDRQLLISRGVPELILADLAKRGLVVGSRELEYQERLLSSFVYLSPQDAADKDCYVLVDCDINYDGINDLRCAVDLEGDIVSFDILNVAFSKLVIDPPEVPDVPGNKPTDGLDAEPSTDPGDESQPDDQNDGLSEGSIDTQDSPQNENGQSTTNADDPATSSIDQDDVPITSDTSTTEKPFINLPPISSSIDRQPLDEYLAIWSFAYSITKDAGSANQLRLATFFRQIDLSFCYQYQYSFETYLWDSHGLSYPKDTASYNSNLRLEQQTYTYLNYWPYTNFTLYVYDLPSEVRVILFINDRTGDCMG